MARKWIKISVQNDVEKSQLWLLEWAKHASVIVLHHQADSTPHWYKAKHRTLLESQHIMLYSTSVDLVLQQAILQFLNDYLVPFMSFTPTSLLFADIISDWHTQETRSNSQFTSIAWMASQQTLPFQNVHVSLDII